MQLNPIFCYMLDDCYEFLAFLLVNCDKKQVKMFFKIFFTANITHASVAGTSICVEVSSGTKSDSKYIFYFKFSIKCG